MPVETLNPLQQEHHHETEDIFKYYSIPNEAGFVRKHRHLPPEQRHFYVRENILKFLSEFAGEVPYNKVSFALTPQGLEFAEMNMGDSYERVAQMAGPGSREDDELISYQKICQELQGGANVIIHISPPKDWNYSFCFVYLNEGYDEKLGHDKISVFPLKYDEQRNTTAQSQKLLEKIAPELNLKTTSEFVRNPIALRIDNPREALDFLLWELEINEEDIRRSRIFETRAFEENSSWIEEYIQEVERLASLPPDQLTQADFIQSQLILTAIYNRTYELRRRLDINTKTIEEPEYAHPSVNLPRDEREAFIFYATQRTMMRSGGGSCPTTTSRGFFSSLDLVESFKKGLSLENTLDTAVCGTCGGPKDGHYHCPNQDCQRKYADETHISNSQRTKECSCGFKFNC